MSMIVFKKLGDVCSFNRGKTITANNAVTGNIPVIAGGQKPSYFHNESNRTGESIVVAGSGAYAGFVSYWNKPIFVSDAFTVDPNQTLIKKYVFHWLKKNQSKIFATQRGAGVPHVHGKDIANFEIPVPTLPEQKRIVRILDIFTSSINNLDEQIEQRQKQYEYYRNKLLSFEEWDEGVEWKPLDSICEIRGRIGFRGYTREDQVSKGEGVISLSPGNIVAGKIDYESCTYITWAKYEESPEIKIFNGDILFCKTGSTVGKVTMVESLPCEATINPQLVVLKNIQINSIYLKQYLATAKLQTQVKALAGVGSVPNISQAKLGNLIIPVPSSAEQQHIANLLDTFESLLTNLKKERELRQKQYEYYREKLLTFA